MGKYKKYKEIYFSGKITYYKKQYDDNKKYYEHDMNDYDDHQMVAARNKHDDKYDYIVEYKRNCNRNNCK
ncbi:spore coat protein C [Bacillus sp. YC2]|uniref:spore coat protein C n=1 Tax=Bacillus sp. YC2 TaxID=2861287 RepID=UPI001CA6B118|nr:spore coat protein C [Bacillus sp. YC2]MBY8914248.1 spore coat protein C [Bacillus sp. YC2]